MTITFQAAVKTRDMLVDKANSVLAQDKIVQLGTSKAIGATKKQLNEINEKAMKTFKNNHEHQIASLKVEIKELH